MINIRPEVTEEEGVSTAESAEQTQLENAPRLSETENQEGMVTGPVIINR